jgi:broad specificity phosphatase PhoE
MARLYLIRHGMPLADWGEADAVPDPGLDLLGKAQAEAARDWLMSRPRDERPTGVVSSPLRRCRETAQPTAQALGVTIEIDPAVGEIPTPIGVARAAREAWLRDTFLRTWSEIEGDLDYERWRTDMVAGLAGRANVAVFSHFVAINAVVSRLAGENRVLVFRPGHASITVLETDGETLTLVAKGTEAVTGVH